MKITVLYEDDNYVVVNKPAGLVVHADGKTTEPTLVDWITKNYPKIKNVGEPLKLSNGETIDRPGIVHRIDRDTSGTLVIVKNEKAFLDLKKKFQDREVQKTYHAFVCGAVKEEGGVIDRPIGRSKKDFRLWSAQRGARGELRDAVTHFRVVARSDEDNMDQENGGAKEPVSFLEIEPKTGRTHQIRVHMKAINHPIVCDRLYAPKRDAALGFERLALHSRKIQFIGIDGKEVETVAPYPADFEKALKTLESGADIAKE